jgi:hypothetical protein
MDHQIEDVTKPSCARCRWAGFFAQPYGAIEHFCSRRQETLSSAALAKRRCPEFEL